VVRCSSCGGENPDGFRHCGHCGALLVSDAEHRRRLATLLFCDLSGSTALGEQIDPEAARGLMLSYFAEMRAILEHHGGTVEKFVGDAVLAVFGVPETHEDDALRACRAALEMRERLAGLNDRFEESYGTRVALRIGINSGEVVAGDPASRETFVTGDPVNVAARLEQAAGPNGILLGESTLQLVRGAVEVEAIEPLAAKGKAEPLAAYRLVSVPVAEMSAGRRETPFTGRERQLEALEREFAGVLERSGCRLVTVLGEPGVGKSRLAAELAGRIGERATVVHGGCLSYGVGITYWPVAAAIRALLGEAGGGSETEVLAALETRLAHVPDGALVAAKIALLLGAAEGTATAAETAWAIRRYLTAEAERRPLALFVDDVHWAEDVLLGILAELPATVPAPLFVVCLSRPELIEGRPEWPAELRLDPLEPEAVHTLIEGLIGDAPVAVRERLAAASGGNPLFLEELVGVLVSGGVLRRGENGSVVEGDLENVELPPTLHALLAARLDTLAPSVRAVLERGAVEGEVFHRAAVAELSSPELRESVPAALTALVAADFVRPVAPAGAGAFSFKHILVRDATYAGISKMRRAELHRLFAGWLERLLKGHTRGFEEVLGYHLEQSYVNRVSLGPPDEDARAVADRAADWLDTGGRRAQARGDSAASAGLFTRAHALATRPERRAAIALRQGVAAREAISVTTSREILAGVLDGARAGGWPALEAAAEVELGLLSVTASTGSSDELRSAGERALATFDALRDEPGRAAALALLAWERWRLLRCGEAEKLFEQALAPAESAGDERLVGLLLRGLARAAVFGPRPARSALERCEGLLERARAIGPMTAASIAMMRTVPEAQLGDLAAARAHGEEARAAMQEFPTNAWITFMPYIAMVALLADDPALAVRELEGVVEQLGEAGEHAYASTNAALRARAHVELGELEEAEGMAQHALELAEQEDAVSQAYAHAALGRALAADGRPEEALREGLLAVSSVEAADVPDIRADVYFDLARVHAVSGAGDRAEEAARAAQELYRAKGNEVGLRRISTFLD
jgi:class 3 adenylate cyclase/tetratricopeptide (TPR) repeat protein